MSKGKQNKLLKAIAKGKCKRILRLCDELGYGPDVAEEFILRAQFYGWKPAMAPRKYSL